MNITVWNEGLHEKIDEKVAAVYPKGIHGCIKDFLEAAGFENVRTATLEEPEHGLTQEVLDQTDVLFYWGHIAHNKVDDAIVDRIFERVMDGMGLIVLHSGHESKLFKKIMGTKSNELRWRENDEMEIMWNVFPSHPIMKGVGANVVIPHEETYGEFFNIAPPDELLMISWFEGGEVFRSACCYNRGRGRIFYFKPGHETYPIYHMPEIQKILVNAANWAYSEAPTPVDHGHHPVPFKDTIERE